MSAAKGRLCFHGCSSATDLDRSLFCVFPHSLCVFPPVVTIFLPHPPPRAHAYSFHLKPTIPYLFTMPPSISSVIPALSHPSIRLRLIPFVTNPVCCFPYISPYPLFIFTLQLNISEFLPPPITITTTPLHPSPLPFFYDVSFYILRLPCSVPPYCSS